MSLAEIEAELANLSADELRHLALRSWSAFVKKEGSTEGAHECSEEDAALLAALDEAVAQADARNGRRLLGGYGAGTDPGMEFR